MITDYEVRHIWGGEKGYSNQIPHGYRACINLHTTGGRVAAELYFRDEKVSIPDNPTPKCLEDGFQHPTYELNFPVSTLSSILDLLRNSEAPVFVFFYNHAGEDEWAVGASGTRKVGNGG